MAFRPYLFFTGQCREAMTRYQEIFGGELVVLTGADVPPDAASDMSPESLVASAIAQLEGIVPGSARCDQRTVPRSRIPPRVMSPATR